MRLRNKILTGFAGTVIALSMIVGTAFAATSPIYTYDEAEGSKESSKDLVICELLSGGGNQDGSNGKVYDELQALSSEAASVDVLLTGNFTGTAHLNLVGDFEFTPTGDGYDNKTYANKEIAVDGHLVYSGEFGPITADARFAFLLRNKSAGKAALEAYILRNADGNIIGGMDGNGFLDAAAAEALFDAITGSAAPAAPAATTDTKTTAAPKTGVESLGLVFGLGAAVLGSGAVVLKRREK